MIRGDGRNTLKAAGFVLAGGRSLRMGRDKAMLPCNGTPLIEHALAIMRRAAEPVRIVGKRHDLTHLAPVIEDRFGGCGPIAGIEAALTASQSELNMFLPVDTPFVPADFLVWMLERAIRSGAVATIPVFHGQPQPLIAIYGGRLLQGLQQAIAVRRLKTIDAIVLASREHGGTDLFRMEVASPLFPTTFFSNEQGAHSMHRWFRNLNVLADLD